VARQPRKPRILNPARTSTDRGSVGRLGGDEFVVIAESVPDAPSALAFAVECDHAMYRSKQRGTGEPVLDQT
jgi:hypothetical protein